MSVRSLARVEHADLKGGNMGSFIVDQGVLARVPGEKIDRKSVRIRLVGRRELLVEYEEGGTKKKVTVYVKRGQTLDEAVKAAL
jgi:hypothetical protein